MKLLQTDDIIVEEKRWRQTFKDKNIKELAESISRLGLLHAPIVTSDNTLIAGETRIRAIITLYNEGKTIRYAGEDVPLGYIPVVEASDLSGRAAKEAEADENLMRYNLTWQERAHAIGELYEVRKAEAEEKDEKYTRTQMSQELADKLQAPRSATEIREDLLLKAWLDDPEIAAAPDRPTALKALTKKLERMHREALAREFDVEKLDTEHTILNEDVFDVLPKLKADEYDCIIADPPYGIDADVFRNQSAVKHAYKDDEEYSDAIMKLIAEQGMRVTKIRAHAYIFCDINRFQTVKAIFEAANWYVWKTPMIWYRGAQIGLLPRPEHGPRRTYEAIVYCIKNDRRVIGIKPDLIIAEHDRSIEYGAHKPPILFENLLSRTCHAGNKVLDPCCGTGPVFPAADKVSAIATGIEINKEAYAYSLARIRDLKEA